jgi:two-component system, NarL family, response regulator YdfI
MAAIALLCSDRLLCRKLEDLLREGLSRRSATVVGVAEDATAVTRLIESNEVDVVLADSLPIDQLIRWTSQYRKPAFVVLTDDTNDEGFNLLRAGAQAILPRSSGIREILTTIEAVSCGLSVIPHAVVQSRLSARAPETNFQNGDGACITLTPRELEVLSCMADGASNKAIARRLGISFHTVKFHVTAILSKLDADTRTEAVTKAAQLGLVML